MPKAVVFIVNVTLIVGRLYLRWAAAFALFAWVCTKLNQSPPILEHAPVKALFGVVPSTFYELLLQLLFLVIADRLLSKTLRRRPITPKFVRKNIWRFMS